MTLVKGDHLIIKRGGKIVEGKLSEEGESMKKKCSLKEWAKKTKEVLYFRCGNCQDSKCPLN